MSILNSISMKRKPTHPGEMLREDFLPDYGLSVSGLAADLGVSRRWAVFPRRSVWGGSGVEGD